MKRGATSTELTNRHCVVCGGEFGPHLKSCCTDRSLVATVTVGLFKKEKKFFALDGTPLTQGDLEELRRVEAEHSRTARIAAAPQHQPERCAPGTIPDMVDTATLHDTTVVPSLASPLPPGKNAIWCASASGSESPPRVCQLQDLYDRHRYLEAFALSADYWNPSTDLQRLSTDDLILAARPAGRLGGLRLSRWLFRAALKRDPSNPRVRYFTRGVQIHDPGRGRLPPDASHGDLSPGELGVTSALIRLAMNRACVRVKGFYNNSFQPTTSSKPRSQNSRSGVVAFPALPDVPEGLILFLTLAP